MRLRRGGSRSKTQESGDVRRESVEFQRMEAMTTKYRVIPAKVQGGSGILVPPVFPSQNVRDYRPNVPLRSRKHNLGQPIQRGIHLPPQPSRSAYDGASVVTVTRAKNRPPNGGALRNLRGILHGAGDELGGEQ